MTSRIRIKVTSGTTGLFTSNSAGLDVEIYTDAAEERPRKFVAVIGALTASAERIVQVIQPSGAPEIAGGGDTPGEAENGSSERTEPQAGQSEPEPDTPEPESDTIEPGEGE
jgi:hypothetical protein